MSEGGETDETKKRQALSRRGFLAASAVVGTAAVVAGLNIRPPGTGAVNTEASPWDPIETQEGRKDRIVCRGFQSVKVNGEEKSVTLDSAKVEQLIYIMADTIGGDELVGKARKVIEEEGLEVVLMSKQRGGLSDAFFSIPRLYDGYSPYYLQLDQQIYGVSVTSPFIVVEDPDWATKFFRFYNGRHEPRARIFPHELCHFLQYANDPDRYVKEVITSGFRSPEGPRYKRVKFIGKKVIEAGGVAWGTHKAMNVEERLGVAPHGAIRTTGMIAGDIAGRLVGNAVENPLDNVVLESFGLYRHHDDTIFDIFVRKWKRNSPIVEATRKCLIFDDQTGSAAE